MHHIATLILLSALLLTVSCGKYNTSTDKTQLTASSIIGGKKVKKGEEPFESLKSVVELDLREVNFLDAGQTKSFICTATKIGSMKYLTAAHCVSFFTNKSELCEDRSDCFLGKTWNAGMQVKNSSLFWGGSTEHVIIDRAYVHPSADVAVVVLQKSKLWSNKHINALPSATINFNDLVKGQQIIPVGIGCEKIEYQKRYWKYYKNSKQYNKALEGMGTFPPAMTPKYFETTIQEISPPNFISEMTVKKTNNLLRYLSNGHAPINSVCPGDSGGPVFNSQGDIIGIIRGITFDETSYQNGELLPVRNYFTLLNGQTHSDVESWLKEILDR